VTFSLRLTLWLTFTACMAVAGLVAEGDVGRIAGAAGVAVGLVEVALAFWYRHRDSRREQ
jgi:hypothetical protein